MIRPSQVPISKLRSLTSHCTSRKSIWSSDATAIHSQCHSHESCGLSPPQASRGFTIKRCHQSVLMLTVKHKLSSTEHLSQVCVCVCFFLIHLRVDPRNLALLCLASSQVVHDGDLETPTEQEATGWTGLDPTRRLPLDGLRRDSVHRKTKRQIMTVCIVFYPMLQPLLEEFLLACLVALHTVTAQVCGAHV